MLSSCSILAQRPLFQLLARRSFSGYFVLRSHTAKAGYLHSAKGGSPVTKHRPTPTHLIWPCYPWLCSSLMETGAQRREARPKPPAGKEAFSRMLPPSLLKRCTDLETRKSCLLQSPIDFKNSILNSSQTLLQCTHVLRFQPITCWLSNNTLLC